MRSEPRTESTRGSVRSGENSPSSHMVPNLLNRNILHLLWKLLRWGIISHINIDIIILCWQCYFTMLLTQMPIFPPVAKDSFFSDSPTLLVNSFHFFWWYLKVYLHWTWSIPLLCMFCFNIPHISKIIFNLTHFILHDTLQFHPNSTQNFLFLKAE